MPSLMLDLESIRVVAAVAESGSVLGASRSLGIARSTVRRRLEAVEAGLETPLFHREGDRLIPTEAGDALARRGRDLLAEARSLATTLREIGGEPRANLRCRIPPGIPPLGLQMFLRPLRTVAPGLRVDLLVGPLQTRELHETIDFAVRFGGPRPEAPLYGEAFGHGRVQLLASAAYLEAHGTIDSPDDLADHDIIVWAPDGEPIPTRLPRWDGPDLVVDPIAVCNDVFLARTLAFAGQGVVWVLDGFDEPLEPEPGLVPVLADQIYEDRTLWLVTSRARAEGPILRRLLEFVRVAYEAGGLFGASMG